MQIFDNKYQKRNFLLKKVRELKEKKEYLEKRGVELNVKFSKETGSITRGYYLGQIRRNDDKIKMIVIEIQEISETIDFLKD